MKKHFVLDPSPETFEAFRRQCEQLPEAWHVCPKILSKIVLIIEELYTNSLKYASTESIEVSLDKKGTEILIEYIDSGPPFNPLKVPPPDLSLPFDERHVGGLGLHLVRHCSDSSSYTREGGKNILRLTKNIAGRHR